MVSSPDIRKSKNDKKMKRKYKLYRKGGALRTHNIPNYYPADSTAQELNKQEVK